MTWETSVAPQIVVPAQIDVDDNLCRTLTPQIVVPAQIDVDDNLCRGLTPQIVVPPRNTFNMTLTPSRPLGAYIFVNIIIPDKHNT